MYPYENQTIDREYLSRLEESLRIREEAFEIMHGIGSGRLSIETTLLADLIETVLAHGEYKYARDLIPRALNDHPDIPAERIHEWYDIMFRARKMDVASQHIAHLVRLGKCPPKGVVVKWAECEIENREYKQAAEMVLQAEATSPRYLDTWTLCRWLNASASDYNGNHGLYRLFALLCRRMRFIRHNSDIYEKAVGILARAISEVANSRYSDELPFLLSMAHDGLSEVTLKQVFASYREKQNEIIRRIKRTATLAQ